MVRLAVSLLAVSAILAPAAFAQDEDVTSAPMVGASLTDKIWVADEADTGLPGSMMLFLSDGTLMQNSCWETYRLDSWQMLSDNSLSWQEDTVTIPAEIVELNEAELVLQLQLMGGEVVERHLTSAPVPYLCPDMPR